MASKGKKRLNRIISNKESESFKKRESQQDLMPCENQINLTKTKNNILDDKLVITKNTISKRSNDMQKSNQFFQYR